MKRITDQDNKIYDNVEVQLFTLKENNATKAKMPRNFTKYKINEFFSRDSDLTTTNVCPLVTM